MNDFFERFDRDDESEPSRTAKWRSVPLLICGVMLVLVTIAATLAIDRVLDQNAPSQDGTSSGVPDSNENAGPNVHPLAFGEQDVTVDSVTVPAGAPRAALLLFDVDVDPTAMASPQAAMVSFRVECRSGGETVEMQSNGTSSTNVFVAHGGTVSGQALTAETDQEMECSLLAAAPFVEATGEGPNVLPMRAELRAGPTDAVHVPALHRLEDASLFTPGTKKNVLSLRVDDPATLGEMSTTVRLTSCTVVGGSRDGDGANKCKASMTGRESSTVRIRVIGRWLDAEGNIASTSTYWDETLGVDYNTHHVPWNLRLDGMAEQVPDDASAAVLVVQVESLAGTPVVVHADGTDAVVSTRT